MAVSSHEEKMINLQHQMRQNQQDMQEFVFDLDSWQEEMKTKEQEIDLQKKKSDEPQVWQNWCVFYFTNHDTDLYLSWIIVFLQLKQNDWLIEL